MQWKAWLPKWQRSEKLFIASLTLLLALYYSQVSLSLLLATFLLTSAAFSWSFVKWARGLLRHFIWHLRNRLIVAFLFIAVIPLLLIVAMAAYGAKEMAGQVAVYLVHAEMDRRLGQLRQSAEALSHTPTPNLERLLDRIGAINEERFPGAQIAVRDGARLYLFPPGTVAKEPPIESDANGLVVRDGVIHGWAHAISKDRRVTILAPLTRRFFSALAPGLGEISVLQDPTDIKAATRRDIRFADDPNDAANDQVPPPVNRLDFDLLWGTRVPIHFWDELVRPQTALLGVHSRMSTVAGVIFSQKTESGILPLLYGMGVVLIIVEIISIMIGITITSTITSAVAELYQGTLKVMRGDFSHRIEVQGDEQIAELTRSFNRMTENVEKLLVVAKENERIQAELQIAREVQNQLFPKSTPHSKHLELHALCQPARSVSGDYYDYQTLPNNKIALALADVAGKGISAALLMASLQSNLRVILREQATNPSVSQTVQRINEQLYANTAPEKYATFFLAIFDEPTSTLHYTNGGHLPPILIRQGKATMLDSNGMIVGAFPFAKYTESTLELHPNDLLICYTDGVTEPENEFGEMFGEERLKETLIRNAHLPAQQIIQTVIDQVQTFTGSSELQDDLTLLIGAYRR